MQVSTVSTNSVKNVFNTRANSRSVDNHTETSKSYINPLQNKNSKTNDRNKLFESINEWKYFCHEQIEKGNLDIIA